MHESPESIELFQKQLQELQDLENQAAQMVNSEEREPIIADMKGLAQEVLQIPDLNKDQRDEVLGVVDRVGLDRTALGNVLTEEEQEQSKSFGGEGMDSGDLELVEDEDE